MLTLTAEERDSHPFGCLVGNSDDDASVELSAFVVIPPASGSSSTVSVR